ncbi:MAG: SDR family NAD(P)-dependent oxidoreductase [Methyloligellaceae bacterium]
MTSHELSGKCALVTGASSGLGADFARQLADFGTHLILVARRTDRLEQLKSDILKSHTVKIDVIPLDLLADGAPRKLYDDIKARGLTVDVLVNNAGYGMHGPFLKQPWERQEAMLRLDMLVVTELTRLFVPDMVERNHGHVLQISSAIAYQPAPTYAAYAAAKSYVLLFGEALKFELRKTNVNCTVLSPGITATEFLEVAGQRPTLYQRLFMMPSDAVVRTGLKAMLARKPSVIPGLGNKLLAFGVRLMPRRALTRVAYFLMKYG